MDKTEPPHILIAQAINSSKQNTPTTQQNQKPTMRWIISSLKPIQRVRQLTTSTTEQIGWSKPLTLMGLPQVRLHSFHLSRGGMHTISQSILKYSNRKNKI